jgi:energy-coupling factor transporter ATP-binding protein EcfA2
MVSKDDLLQELDFGSVDAESEEKLAKRFVRTKGFSSIVDDKTLIILGPKGSGKSAIYRLFADFIEESKDILGSDFPEDTHIVKATGGDDVKSIDDRSLKEMMKQEDFSYERFWRVYIALKTASKLGAEGYESDGELGDVLRAFNQQPDWRIIPVFKTFWQKIIGDPPSEGSLSYGNFSIEINSRTSVDIGRLLEEEEKVLEKNGECIWLMLDRIDELRSKELEERKELLEALFRTQINFMGRFENIHLKIFLRTDIWSELSFTNKSHIVDKRIRLNWDDTQLLRLINKRMLQSDLIKKELKNPCRPTLMNQV